MSGEQTTEPTRDKIAAVIREHRWGYVDDDGEGCTCCSTRIHYDNWPEHLAAELWRALGLTEETRSTTDPYEVWYGAPIVVERRWVSGWSVVGGDPK